MSHKSTKIAAILHECCGGDVDPHFLGYMRCFNRQLFYESHDVLEELWLGEKQGPRGEFYKALIQFAGAFVHLQKNRLQPAASLFRSAKRYLQKYPPVYERLNVAGLIDTINHWLADLEGHEFTQNPLSIRPTPMLELLKAS